MKTLLDVSLVVLLSHMFWAGPNTCNNQMFEIITYILMKPLKPDPIPAGF